MGIDDSGSVDPEELWLTTAHGHKCVCPSASPRTAARADSTSRSPPSGMGPHGLFIGATGSGKSEFLRTLVLGLITRTRPRVLNMVLVDFKGGATFAGLERAPHVSAVITNLADELTLVDRMQDALSGEMVRRQELLREAGNYANVRDYEKARAAGADAAAAAGAVHRGRRVLRDAAPQAGVHRPVRRDRPARPVAGPAPAARLAAAGGGPAARPRDPPVLPDRPAHVLRRESRAVLGVPTPTSCRVPGGLPQAAPDELLRFKAAYVSGPRRRTARSTQGDPQSTAPVSPRVFTAVAGGRRSAAARQPLEAPSHRVLDAV